MSADKKDIDPREWYLLVRFLTYFIMLRSIRDGMFFLYPEQLSEATSTILALFVVTNIISIVALGLLMGWYKIGFWIFLGIQIANVPLCLMAGIGKIQSLFGVFSAVLLWLFLHIPKGSYSGWDYLSGNYTTIRQTETTERSKKCRMCDTVYSRKIDKCPKCGSSLYEETAAKNKKCRMCSTVYTGELIGCPACGSSLYEETNESIYKGTGNGEQGTGKNEQLEVRSEQSTDINLDDKKAEIERLEKLFDATSDGKEKSLIAKQLYELGVMYYWRFMPKDK